MAEKLIPPRRNEPVISPNGMPTTRFAEYIERVARVQNDTTEAIESGDIAGSTIDDELLHFWIRG